MEGENEEPKDEREYATGKSNKHQPTQYAERIKKLAVIVSFNDAGMHRAFIHFTAVRIRNRTAQHH